VDPNITTLERAFQLAQSGECSTLDDIKQRLKAEGYPLAQLTGYALNKQLLAIMRKAQEGPKL
jgi:hypothetical protein